MSFNRYQIKHYLADYNGMPIEALATVTDEDLAKYTDEYDEFQEKQKADVSDAREISTSVLTNVEKLFGRYSKEHRYFERKITSGDDLISRHGSKFPSPGHIRDGVADAKERASLTSNRQDSGTITEDNMNTLDEAITFLSSEGFVYGKDFSAHNASDVANGIAVQRVMENPESIGLSYEAGASECSECNDFDREASVSRFLTDGMGECSCGNHNYRLRLSYTPELQFLATVDTEEE